MNSAMRAVSLLGFGLILAAGVAHAGDRDRHGEHRASRHEHAASPAYADQHDRGQYAAPWCPTHSSHHNHSYGYYGFNGGYYGVYDGTSYEEVFSRAYDNGYSDGYNALTEESGGSKPYRRGYAQGYRDGRRDSRNHNRFSDVR